MKKNILLFGILAFLLACSRNEKNIGTPENPFIMGFSKPYFEKLSDKDLQFFETYLSNQTGLMTKVLKYEESSELLNDIGKGKIDSAILTVNEYFIARQDYKVIPVLQVIRGEDEKKYFAGIATLSSNKNINRFEDLAGKKIAARDPYSMSGFVLPSLLFSDIKPKPEFVFTGSHEESLKKLYAGEVEAVSVYKKLIKANPNLKLIQPMGPVPNEPFICRKDLKKEYCERIKITLKSFNELKEGKEILSKMADISGFDEVTPYEYKDLYNIIYNFGKDIYSLIPDGIKLKKIQEPYYFD